MSFTPDFQSSINQILQNESNRKIVYQNISTILKVDYPQQAMSFLERFREKRDS